MRALRGFVRGLGRLVLFVIQMAYVLLLGEIVPMLTLAVLGADKKAFTIHWLPPASIAFWVVCWLAAVRWGLRARRRARAARWSPPPSPPGQPMPEPVEQWPEVAGYAVVRRLPDGSVVIQPSRGQNVA